MILLELFTIGSARCPGSWSPGRDKTWMVQRRARVLSLGRQVVFGIKTQQFANQKFHICKKYTCSIVATPNDLKWPKMGNHRICGPTGSCFELLAAVPCHQQAHQLKKRLAGTRKRKPKDLAAFVHGKFSKIYPQNNPNVSKYVYIPYRNYMCGIVTVTAIGYNWGENSSWIQPSNRRNPEPHHVFFGGVITAAGNHSGTVGWISWFQKNTCKAKQ